MLNTFQWILIIGSILVIFLLVKVKYIKHKLTWILIIIIIIILYLGFIAISSQNEIKFNSVESTGASIKLYLSWFGHNFQNLKTLTGQAINLDWGTNSTAIKNQLTNNKKT